MLIVICEPAGAQDTWVQVSAPGLHVCVCGQTGLSALVSSSGKVKVPSSLGCYDG